MNRLKTLVLALALTACVAKPMEAPAKQDPTALLGTTWTWAGTLYGDDKRIDVADPTRYTLAFQPAGRVNVRADCNRGSGGYSADPNRLEIGAIALTKMLCAPGSQDREFLRGLAAAGGWLLKDGELIVILKVDTGTMRFKPLPK